MSTPSPMPENKWSIFSGLPVVADVTAANKGVICKHQIIKELQWAVSDERFSVGCRRMFAVGYPPVFL
jgi:hypothetical protein